MVDSSGKIVADGIGARSLEQDYGDINKALKMCSKSAHIDATLRMAGLSEVFTQDLDQMAADGKLGDVEAPKAETEQKQAQDYARRFNEAFELGLEQAVLDLCEELKGHQELHVAVWGYLPSGMRKQIKELLERAKGETEAGTRG
jgi:hypothetical protein